MGDNPVIPDINVNLKLATDKRPGNVLTLETEIENGKLIYEVDMLGKAGKEMEVEIVAVTSILAGNPEKEMYQIGEEK